MSSAPLFYWLSNSDAVLILAFVGGFVDSAGYIKLFGLFTSSITGNLVVACSALFKNNDGIFARLFVTLLFAVGAFATTLTSLHLRQIRKVNQWLVAMTLFGAEVLVLAVAIAVGEYIESTPEQFPALDSWQSILVGAILALSMGIHSAAALETIKNCPSTTVMTANIVKTSMAAASAAHLQYLLQNGSKESAVIEEEHAKVREARVKLVEIFLVILLFVIGAGAGAILTMNTSLWGLVVPVALLLLVILSIHLAQRQHIAAQKPAAPAVPPAALVPVPVPVPMEDIEMAIIEAAE